MSYSLCSKVSFLAFFVSSALSLLNCFLCSKNVFINISWIRINKDLELLDTPGILWPKLENQKYAHNLAVLSSIKEDIIDPEQLANYIITILYELYPERVKKRYNVTNVDLNNMFEFYDNVGKNRGALLKDNKIDYDKVFSIIINDLKNNKFGNITFDRIEG